MSDIKTQFQELVDDLRKAHDELALKMHLAKMDAKAEWENLEAKWKELEQRVGPALSESAENIEAATKFLADEMKAAFERLKKAL